MAVGRRGVLRGRSGLGARYYSNGTIVSFFDNNGADAGCVNYYPGFYANGYYVSYNVCVETEGCGSPLYRLGWGSPVW